MANTTWNLDAAHSELSFSVKHMMISNVTGTFGKFDTEVSTEDEDFSTARISFTADVDSISTKNEQRDEHLKSPDFFDAASHPQLRFESTTFEKKSEDNYMLHGNLTMRGITKPVSLKTTFGGIIKDPYGLIRSGFSLEGSINRKDFGLNWSTLTEAGGMVVSDEVRLAANVELTKA